MNNQYHQALPQSTETYRQSTKAQLHLVHKRRKCSCGAVITEKDSKRFGGCEKCWQNK